MWQVSRGRIVAVRAEVLKEKEGKGGGKERGETKRFGGRDRVTPGGEACEGG